VPASLFVSARMLLLLWGISSLIETKKVLRFAEDFFYAPPVFSKCIFFNL